MPRSSPRTSWRRFTPRKLASARAASSSGTPSASTVASAASAFSTLHAAEQRHAHARGEAAAAIDVEAGAFRIGRQRARAPGVRVARLERRSRRRGTARRAITSRTPSWSSAATSVPSRRQARHERAERLLHVLEIAVDVGVVELDRRDHQRARVVVQELRRLVEEGRVVLVALDDEVLALPFAEAPVEVERVAADQQRRIAPGSVQQRRDQARGGRLAVRAGDHDRVLARDRELVERVRERAVGEPLVDRGARLGIVRAHRVADHDEIGPDARARARRGSPAATGMPQCSSSVLIGG